MSETSRSHPFPTSTTRRLSNRIDDVALVERASGLIRELGVELDRRLQQESRPPHRMRMLRETTNRITRVANDAVQAYARANRTIRAELERPDGDADTAASMRLRLDTSRREVLAALASASERYDTKTVIPDQPGEGNLPDQLGDADQPSDLDQPGAPSETSE